MALYEFRHVFVTLLLLTVLTVIAAEDFGGLSKVTVQVFEPKGFRASIKDVDRLALFAVQGVAKRGDNTIDVQGETATPIGETDNEKTWVVDLPHVQLKVGDELNFLAFAAVDTSGYIRDNIEHKVTELIPFVPLKRPSSSPCVPPLTRVRDRVSLCAGQTIFEENFDFLRKEIWEVQKYVPVDHPELPFVSYQPSAVSVKDGNLRIVPSLQVAQPGFSHDNNSLYSKLDLRDGCTEEQAKSCYMDIKGGNQIIPPVISGRLISKPGFAFAYGTIIIRAKLPQGDWIYPELLLEPLMKKFTYLTQDSGMLKIACAHGNKELIKDSNQYGNKILYSGAVLVAAAGCHYDLLNNKTSNQSWGDSFHEYSVKWTNESLIFSVDGVKYATVKPEPSKGLRSQLQETCRPKKAQTGIEPFDDLFYITLGLAVGGNSEFLDATVSMHNHAKPWRNHGAKATIDFWKDVNAWHSTWHQPELLVDYVKVVAV